MLSLFFSQFILLIYVTLYFLVETPQYLESLGCSFKPKSKVHSQTEKEKLDDIS